jgi:DNA (cytosine-5)-methyltransferase 1
MTTSVHVIDFFCGCGGTSLGLQEAGLEITAGIDHDEYASATFRQNFPGAVVIPRDIRNVTMEDIADLLDDRPVVFSGCAPCQPFSVQNMYRSKDDPRRGLLSEFERFVVLLRPEYVVVENVPGAQRFSETGPFHDFTVQLLALGYKINSGILRAGDFGVPQERRRLVIVAALGQPVRLPTAGPATERKDVTVRETIGHLARLSAGEVSDIDPDHAAMRLSPLNMQRIRATPEGGSRRDWPDDLGLICHSSHAGHSDVYGRMRWDRPAAGLTTRCLSYSNGRFGHPEQDRAISAREAACLQTFPETFQFHGPLTEKGRQIGNAVPPRFAQRIGHEIVVAAN